MYIFKSMFFVLCFLLLAISTTIAEPRKRLSQLEFDAKDEDIPNDKAKLLDQILNPNSAKDSKVKDPSSELSANNLFDEKLQNITPSVANKYIPLKLKGPLVDKFDLGAITSTFTWKRGVDKNCRDSSSFESKCMRIKALKQILQRFSGSNDFFETSCDRYCDNPKKKSLLYNLQISEATGIALQSFEDKAGCHFRFSQETVNKWKALELEKIQCLCISECLLE